MEARVYSLIHQFICLIYQFKEIDSEIRPCLFCLGNILKIFTINNMKRTWLKWYTNSFSVDCNTADTNDIMDINNYWFKFCRA